MKPVNLYNEYLKSSLEIGESYCKMRAPSEKEPISENFDFTQSFEKKVGEKMDYSQTIKVLDYHISEIHYTLNSNQTIQTLEMVYKSRNDLTSKTLLKTVNSSNSEVQTIKFIDNEEIIEVLFYVHKDNKRLVALSFKTNLDKVKIIGNTSNGIIQNDEGVNNKNNIICGFGGYSCEQYGVSSLYCYYMEKNKYGIVLYNGLLQLRAKLRKDEKFKKTIIEKRSSLSEKMQFILEVCNLPDTGFFPVAGYIMSI